MAAVTPPPDLDEPSPELLDARIGMHLQRHLSGVRKLIAAALIAALGSIGAAAVRMLDASERAGADKVRLQVIERDLSSLAAASERHRLELERLRIDLFRFRPDFPTGPSSSTSKGTP